MPNDLPEIPTQIENVVHVSTGALLKRINRILAKQGEVIRTSRSERARFDFGRFYLLDTDYNGISGTDIDLEGAGRELGVLADNEEWRDEEDAAPEEAP